MAAEVDVRGARCLAEWFLQLVDAVTESTVRYDEVLVRQIRRSFAESGESYGVRRVWPDVLAWGYGCGRERVARLMRQEKLQARPPPAPFAP